MQKKKIRSLLFDLGNVLFDIDIEGAHERLSAFLRKDAHKPVIEKALLDFECGLISTDIFINAWLSQSHKEVQALDIIEAWNSMLIGMPRYRLDMLEMLKARYNIYLLSNTNALHLEWVHRYFNRTYGVDQFEKQYFHQAYYSHLVSDRKPNASIFKYVAEDSFMTPDHTLFMDDMKDNIEAASQLGFKTYLVKPGEEIAEYLKVQGFY